MTRGLPEGPVIVWYGDDFTGSSAVMEVLTFGGLPAVLFLEPPTSEDLARFPGMRGVGIASTARAQSPEWMEEHLPASFNWMKGTSAPICHYKACSTFDSAPHVGSIGRAADVAARIFGDPLMPMLIAAPAIRRYQAFGHLFAGAGNGVFRLDRHPVMAHHPVTPMVESDVTRHLAVQTNQRIALLDLEALASADHGQRELDRLLAEGSAIVALDTMTHDDLTRAGAIIWRNRHCGRFILGSQGVEYALLAYFQEAGWLPPPAPAPALTRVEQLPVVSGSVSPITAGQIAHAERNGFRVIPLDATRLLVGDAEAEAVIDETLNAALACLESGASPLIASAQGPDDPAVRAFREATRRHALAEAQANAAVGNTLGRLLAHLLDRTGLTRAVVSGGDTSGAVTQRLDVRALTALAATTPGAALFTAHRTVGRAPIELALKGGQMGDENLFAVLRDGTVSST